MKLTRPPIPLLESRLLSVLLLAVRSGHTVDRLRRMLVRVDAALRAVEQIDEELRR